MELEKEITNFLNEWRRQDGGEDSYIVEKSITTESEQEDIYFLDAIQKFLTEKEDVIFNINYINGFDSPGYSFESYALAILIEGKINIYPINIEFF